MGKKNPLCDVHTQGIFSLTGAELGPDLVLVSAPAAAPDLEPEALDPQTCCSPPFYKGELADYLQCHKHCTQLEQG